MPVSIVEKFRHRTDKMIARETFPESGRVVERFAPGRPDKLKQHEYHRSSSEPTEYVSRFHSESRPDALDKRIVKDMELAEFYEAAADNDLGGGLSGGGGGLKSMRVTFFLGEKKFGPAEEQTKGNREIEKITGTEEVTMCAGSCSVNQI